MSKQNRALQVEALTYSDSIDSLVDRHFRNRPAHRAEDAGPYDVERMVKSLGGKLLRSRQEYATSPSGLTTRLLWASLCFELETGVFATLLAKGSSSARAHNGDDEFKVTVTAASPQGAAEQLAKLRKEFLPQIENQGPAFFIMTGGRRVQRVPLEETHRLSAETLGLHYGEEAGAWSQEFMAALSEPGISILRGEAGTGKTSMIRHVMCNLAATHRFYFVPVDNFGLLSSGNLTEFWKSEQRDHPAACKVLVLEDAETLLLERDHEERSPVSSLLNLTDGLMTQFVRLHLIATLNCKREDVDKALLRPGRLRCFKEFERIPHARASLIAKATGRILPDRQDFTLAEVFASEQFERRTTGAAKPQRPVGFAR